MPRRIQHRIAGELKGRKPMKRIYLLRLNESRSGMGPVRFAAYTETPEGLKAIWPDCRSSPDWSAVRRNKHCGDEAAKLGMDYRSPKDGKYPAFHYSRNGCGYSKETCIAEDISMLVYPGEVCEVHTITGWAPSLVGRFLDGKYAERSEGGVA